MFTFVKNLVNKIRTKLQCKEVTINITSVNLISLKDIYKAAIKVSNVIVLTYMLISHIYLLQSLICRMLLNPYLLF